MGRGLRAPACRSGMNTRAVLCPIIVFMLTLLIKSAPRGHGRDYSRDRSAGISKCVREVGAPLVWAGGGRSSPGAGEGPRWGVATLGTCLRGCPVGGVWASAGSRTGGTPFLRLRSLPWGWGAGRRTQAGTW